MWGKVGVLPMVEWDTLNIGMCLKPAVLDSSKYSIKLKPVVGFVAFVIYLEIFPTSNCRKRNKDL